MSHGPPDLSGVIEATPREVPSAVRAGSIAAMVVGAAAFGYGLATEPIAAKAAFVHNFIYFGAMSQGDMMFSIEILI